MTRFAVLLLMAVLLPAAQVLGADLPAHCLKEETAAINVQLQAVNNDANVARRELQSSIAEIQSFAKQSGMTQMAAGGVNYSITPLETNSETQYQVHGNINFLTAPSSKAVALVEGMRKQNYQAILSFVTTNGVTGHISNKCRLVTATGWE